MSVVVILFMTFMAVPFSPAAKAPPMGSFTPMSKSHGLATLKTHTQEINGLTRLVVIARPTLETSAPLKISWELPSQIKLKNGQLEQAFVGKVGKEYEFAIEVENYHIPTKTYVSFEITGIMNDQKMGSTAIFSNQESQSLETQMVQKNKDAQKRPLLQK